MKPTTHDVAMRLVRGRGTPTSTPEFIAAYLSVEARKWQAEAEAYVEQVIAAWTAAEQHAAQHTQETNP